MSTDIQKALQELHNETQYNCPTDAGVCWSAFIDAVIEITRQDSWNPRTKDFMLKDEIVTRAFIQCDFDPEDFGLRRPE